MAELQHLLDTLTGTHHLLPANFLKVDLISPDVLDLSRMTSCLSASMKTCHQPVPCDTGDKIENSFVDCHTSEGLDSNANQETVSLSLPEHIMKKARQKCDTERQLLIQEVLHTTRHANDLFNIHTAARVLSIIEAYETDDKTKTAGGQLTMPDMSKMNLQQQDPSKGFEHFAKELVNVLKRVLSFCKHLLGFTMLERGDQIKLFKQGSFEVMVTWYTLLLRPDGMFTPQLEKKIPRMAVSKIPMGDLFEEQYKFALPFNDLHLTDTEVGVISAIMMFNPNREDLVNRPAVHKLQCLYAQALLSSLRSRCTPENAERTLEAALSLLPVIRHINDLHFHHIATMRQSASSFPDLHDEVFRTKV